MGCGESTDNYAQQLCPIFTSPAGMDGFKICGQVLHVNIYRETVKK